jgi:beta-phosphoglucomutase-like phosphatase (HAD superfamily)
MMEAILFDCDGVLVDTEARANDAMADLFTKAGFALSGLECRTRFQGLSLPAVAAKLADEVGTHIAVADIQAAVDSALSSGVQEVPGASRIVRGALVRDLPICVASSGSVEKMQMTLGQTGLLPLFKGRLFSTAQVRQGKPAPDIFLHAAEQLRVDITRSVVIEDSLAGIRAGVASGARVIALCRDPFASPEAARSEGAIPVSSLDEAMHHMGLKD